MSLSTEDHWLKRPAGLIYLTLLGVALLVTVGLAVTPAGRGSYAAMGKAAMLMWPVGVLDVLLAIGIGVWAFRTRHWRLRDAPVGDVFLGIILFFLVSAATVAFLFFACLGVADF